MIRILPAIEKQLLEEKMTMSLPPPPPTIIITDDRIEDFDRRLKVVEKIFVTDTELAEVVDDVKSSFELFLNNTPRLDTTELERRLEKKIDESIRKKLEIIDTSKEMVKKIFRN
jgi:hypothetical protein